MYLNKTHKPINPKHPTGMDMGITILNPMDVDMTRMSMGIIFNNRYGWKLDSTYLEPTPCPSLVDSTQVMGDALCQIL